MVLPKTSPYLHFNAPGAGSCYGRLFEGVEQGDDDDDDDDDDGDDDWDEGGDWVDDDDFVLFEDGGLILRDLYAGRNLNNL